MPNFVLHHEHEPGECAVVFAAWKGHPSPLRGHSASASCRYGGHEIWWELEAPTESHALGQLPAYVADRTRAIRVTDVRIP